MSRFKLSRRHFLRGLGGIAVGLPTLDAMLNSNGTALAGGASLPRRFMLAYDGQSIGADGDTVHNEYEPDATGFGYDLKTALAPFGWAEFEHATRGPIQNEISVISGLRVESANGGSIPEGGRGDGFHIQAMSPILSGVRSEPGGYDVYGPTPDQVIADFHEGVTPFRSLVYLVQASWYLTVSAPYGRDEISHRDMGGYIQPVTPQSSPRAAWQALFSAFGSEDPEEQARIELELRKRGSVLDTVLEDAHRLNLRLGAADRIRLEQHLEEMRALEVRLESALGGDGECQKLEDPGDDPAIGGAQESTGGSDYDTSRGWSDEETRAQIFCDLIHMAFTCDLARAASLCITMAQSHMSAVHITEGGYPYDLHELGHSWTYGTHEISEAIAWHMKHFAYLTAKLRDTPEGDGSVLDNCALAMTHEGGHGWDPEGGDDNSSHSTENMCMLLAGGAGDLRPGHHIRADGMHPANVLISAMHAVGVEEDLGEVRGVIPELFG